MLIIKDVPQMPENVTARLGQDDASCRPVKSRYADLSTDSPAFDYGDDPFPVVAVACRCR